MTIEVIALGKKYGSKQAIEDISFIVQTGEVMGLLGMNGAGKTTIMRVLAGALRPSSGSATIAGHHIQSLAARCQVGYLPETVPLYREMTVKDFLIFVAAISQVPARQRQKSVQKAIERCGLGTYQNSLIRKLSQGYRQRLGIAQAIVHNPPVIILDEPTRGLDPSQIISMRELIQELATDHTILLSSHILAEVQMTCQLVTIIHEGRLVTTDTPSHLARLIGGNNYDLECTGEPTTIKKILQEMPLVGAVKILPTEKASRVLLVVTAADDANDLDLGSELVSMLVAQGIAVHGIRRSNANLEDAFLALTKNTTKDIGQQAEL
jgi:ABC-2 type transport system ATP-binding protein